MSNKIPTDFIQSLVAQTDIVAIIDSRIPLVNKGANYHATCPFHEEKTPSFTVSAPKQFYHCFGCQANGNVISFLMDYDNMDFVQAVEYLADFHHIPMPKSNTDQGPKINQRILEEVRRYYQSELRKHPNAKAGVDYLKQRGLSGELAKAYALGFAPPGWDNVYGRYPDSADRATLNDLGLLIPGKSSGAYDRFRNRIMYPIRNPHGKTIGFGGRVISPEDTPKYLNSPETPLFQKRKTLYGLYELLQKNNKPPYIIVVEGYMDVLALAQYGMDNVVATLGTAITAEHIHLLERYSKTIVLCFDGDKAGKSASTKAMQIILPVLRDDMQFKFMFLPEGLDPDDFIRTYGKAHFEHSLEKAQSLTSVLFDKLLAEYNLNSTDAKVQLMHAFSALIAPITSTLYIRMLTEQLSKYVQIEPQRLSDMLTKDSKETTATPALDNSPLSLAQKCLALIFQYPAEAAKARQISEALSKYLKEFALAQRLIKQCQASPMSTGELLELCRGMKSFVSLKKLAGTPLALPQDAILTEINSIIHHFEQKLSSSRQHELLRLAKLQPLSIEEKQELQQLLIDAKQVEQNASKA